MIIVIEQQRMKERRKVKFASNIEDKKTENLLTHRRNRTQEELVSHQEKRVYNAQQSLRKGVFCHQKNETAKSIEEDEWQRQYSKVLDLREAAMKQYTSLMEIYETNEWKLKKILEKELRDNKEYLYSKEILQFIKAPNEKQLKKMNIELFKNDVSKLTHFLTQFNARKKIKQVEIMRDSLLSRQKLIRNSATYGQYQNMYNKMRSEPLNSQGFTIYDQFRLIRRRYNIPLECEQIHEKYSLKISEAEQRIFSKIKEEAGVGRGEKEMYGVLMRKMDKQTSPPLFQWSKKKP